MGSLGLSQEGSPAVEQWKWGSFKNRMLANALESAWVYGHLPMATPWHTDRTLCQDCSKASVSRWPEPTDRPHIFDDNELGVTTLNSILNRPKCNIYAKEAISWSFWSAKCSPNSMYAFSQFSQFSFHIGIGSDSGLLMRVALWRYLDFSIADKRKEGLTPIKLAKLTNTLSSSVNSESKKFRCRKKCFLGIYSRIYQGLGAVSRGQYVV